MTDIHTSDTMEDKATIDLLPAFKAVIQYWWLILLTGVIFAIGTFISVKLLVTPMYASEFTIYVNNHIPDSKQQSSVLTEDLAASRSLANTYAQIIGSRSVLEQAAAQADMPYSYKELCDMITVSPVRDIEIVSVSVVTSDPIKSLLLAQSIANTTMTKVSDIVEGSSMQILDEPQLASEPRTPNMLKSTAIGASIGIILSIVTILALYILDINVNTDTLSFRFGFPVFECIPANAFSEEHTENDQAIQESYRTMRTHVAFSMSGNESCCIAVTCADRLSDKSSISINLAITFAQTGKKVLLIDCDMQQKTLTKIMDMNTEPGLSDFLAEKLSLVDVIYKDIANVDIIPAGRIPDVPKMLLESGGIDLLIRRAREKYDYIFLDLASMNAAADAVVMAQCSDGFLLVLRQNKTKNKAVEQMLRNLGLAGGKIIGFVVHDSLQNRR